MADSYTQIHIHLIIAVKFRRAQIHKSWKNELYKYITGVIQHYGHKVLVINGVEDHIHILIGMRPNQALSDLVNKLKANSSRWINKEKHLNVRFLWQRGYSAFSCSKSIVPTVTRYIINQENHHANKTLINEQKRLLKYHKVNYRDEHLLKQPI